MVDQKLLLNGAYYHPPEKPQSMSTALPMTNTTFSTNQNTNQQTNFAAKKPVGNLENKKKKVQQQDYF